MARRLRLLAVQSFFPWLGNFLFEPRPKAPAELRRKCRLLASLLLISLIILGINLKFEYFPVPRARAFLALGALPLLIAYALSRVGSFALALAIAMGDLVALVVVIFIAFTAYNAFEPALALVWLVIPVFLASFFLSFIASIFVVLSVMVPFFALMPLVSGRAFYGWLLALVFYITVSCLILIWSRYRGLVERDRVAELQRHATRLENSVVQKDALLREVHHRVKNNLQVISSLLFLQSRRSPENREPFLELQARIRSMSQVYERLNRSDELSRIGLADYLEELVLSVIRSYAVSGISLHTKGFDKGIMLDADAAVSVGLIVTELVTNSLKYAFGENGGGIISLELEMDGERLKGLVVGDDGHGIEEAGTGGVGGASVAPNKGIGLQIVHALARQIDAEVERIEGKGAVYRIKFGIPPGDPA